MTLQQPLSRRKFLQTSAGAVLFLSTSSFGEPHSLPRQQLGQTSLYISNIGFGTGMLHRTSSKKEAHWMLQEAYDHGINFFDTAHNYGAGQSEILLGKALHHHRDEIVLSTKTMTYHYDGAKRDLETSLKRLQTDYLDLWILHNVKAENFTSSFSSHGVYRAMLEAQQQGKCRYIGISASTNPFVLSKFLTLHSFDVVMMPLNAVDPHYLSFEKHVLPYVLQNEQGCIALKPFAMGALLKNNQITMSKALRYTMSLPIHSTLVGFTTRQELQLAFSITHSPAPITSKQREDLLARTSPLAGRQTEWYKSQFHPRYLR